MRVCRHGRCRLGTSKVGPWNGGQEAVISDGARGGYRGVKDDDSGAVIIGWNKEGVPAPGVGVFLLGMWRGKGCIFIKDV